MDSPRCLQESDECQGEVEYHINPDREDLKAFPRCEKHQRDRLISAQEHIRKYPRIEPSDFDPMYAGERWEED